MFLCCGNSQEYRDRAGHGDGADNEAVRAEYGAAGLILGLSGLCIGMSVLIVGLSLITGLVIGLIIRLSGLE